MTEIRKKRTGIRRGIYLLPNLITTANLFCGFFAITKSIQGQFEYAAWLIILAGLLDFLDGRVARMTHSQSEFGVEYDSLSDLTTFCMAPAILSYLFGLQEFGRVGIAAAFLFFACGALRLARFNVQSASVEKYDFQGMPTPTGGGMIASYILFYMEVFGDNDKKLYFLLAMIIGLGLLMVSNVRYRSLKRVKRTSFLFMVLVVATVFLLAAKPTIMFFVVGSIYVLSGVVEWVWTAPQKIRGIKDLVLHIFNEKREDLVLEDEDNEVSEASNIEEREDEITTDTDEESEGGEEETLRVINPKG